MTKNKKENVGILRTSLPVLPCCLSLEDMVNTYVVEWIKGSAYQSYMVSS
jgi:hypothetical protein